MPFHRIRSSRAVGARRCLGFGASALLTAVIPFVLGITPMASASDCPDAEVIFARGTDEPAGMGRVGDALVDSLRSQTGGLTIRTYAVNYKATKLQLHGGDGAKDAISHIESTVSTCPDTKIVLGGYSQGASVIDIVAGVSIGGFDWHSPPLPPQYAKNVTAVVTFGDAADRAGGSLPTQSALLGSKAIDLCNPGDPICHAGPGNSWKGHTDGYVPEYTDQAATFVAGLLTGSNPTVPGYGSQTPGYGQEPGDGYGPQLGYGPLPGPQSGVDPSVQIGPQTPGYGSEAPGPDSQEPGSGPGVDGPTSSSVQLGLVSSVH